MVGLFTQGGRRVEGRFFLVNMGVNTYGIVAGALGGSGAVSKLFFLLVRVVTTVTKSPPS